MLYQSSGSSGGGLVPFGAGVGVGAGASAAAMWARKVQGRANLGMGLGILNTGVMVIGGNDNNQRALDAANLTNTINSRTFSLAPTGAEVGLLKQDLGTAVNLLSRVASNTDPMSVTGLRTTPTLPPPTSAITSSTIPLATTVQPSSGLGSVGILLLVGAVIYVATRD